MRIKVLFYSVFLALTAQAETSFNVYDRLYLVVQNIDEEGQFFVERVPMIGCKVLTYSARLEQFTTEYLAPSNLGCGTELTKRNEDINALSCTKVIKTTENTGQTTYAAISLDISQCPERNNPQFINMIRTAAKYNFPQTDPKKEVRLTFVK